MMLPMTMMMRFFNILRNDSVTELSGYEPLFATTLLERTAHTHTRIHICLVMGDRAYDFSSIEPAMYGAWTGLACDQVAVLVRR